MYDRIKEGITLAKNGQYKEAIAKYDEALVIDPQNVEALVAKGAAKFNLRSFIFRVGPKQASLDF